MSPRTTRNGTYICMRVLPRCRIIDAASTTNGPVALGFQWVYLSMAGSGTQAPCHACAYVRLHADTLCSAYLFSVEGWRSRENSARNQALQQCGVNSISHSWVDGRKDLTEPCVSLREATNSKMSNSRTIRTTKTNHFNKVSATS